jgi:hypothetical protein
VREQELMTQTMKFSDVTNTLSSLVNKVLRKGTRILVENYGIPVAALVSAEDLKLVAHLTGQCADRRRVISAMRRYPSPLTAPLFCGPRCHVVGREPQHDRIYLFTPSTSR